jgi:hypothetical protein
MAEFTNWVVDSDKVVTFWMVQNPFDIYSDEYEKWFEENRTTFQSWKVIEKLQKIQKVASLK